MMSGKVTETLIHSGDPGWFNTISMTATSITARAARARGMVQSTVRLRQVSTQRAREELVHWMNDTCRTGQITLCLCQLQPER